LKNEENVLRLEQMLNQMLVVRQFDGPDYAIKIVYGSSMTINLKLMNNICINRNMRIQFIQN